jgi:hypothetical protein
LFYGIVLSCLIHNEHTLSIICKTLFTRTVLVCRESSQTNKIDFDILWLLEKIEQVFVAYIFLCKVETFIRNCETLSKRNIIFRLATFDSRKFYVSMHAIVDCEILCHLSSNCFKLDLSKNMGSYCSRPGVVIGVQVGVGIG